MLNHTYVSFEVMTPQYVLHPISVKGSEMGVSLANGENSSNGNGVCRSLGAWLSDLN